jgi:hypothetical protein
MVRGVAHGIGHSAHHSTARARPDVALRGARHRRRGEPGGKVEARSSVSRVRDRSWLARLATRRERPVRIEREGGGGASAVARIVVGQEPLGVDAAEQGLGGKVGLSVLEGLVVALTLGRRHSLAFDHRLRASARESAPEALQHPGILTRGRPPPRSDACGQRRARPGRVRTPASSAPARGTATEWPGSARVRRRSFGRP